VVVVHGSSIDGSTTLCYCMVAAAAMAGYRGFRMLGVALWVETSEAIEREAGLVIDYWKARWRLGLELRKGWRRMGPAVSSPAFFLYRL